MMEEKKEVYLERTRNQWNEKSDSWYPILRTDEIINRIVRNPESSFHKATFSMIRKYVPDIRGKRILVPSSGDNHAVFSFAQMGALVTSSDFAERQLENAAEIAHKQGWQIEFVCDNTMTLDKIESDAYDLVYTSNGVHVWIYDLESMYKNIHRVLKKLGACVMFDVHPFNRPFEYKEGEQPTIVKQYTDVEPHYHWRIQDLLNTMISTGFVLRHIEEMYTEDGHYWNASYGKFMSEEESARLCDWKRNPIAALPQWISICLQKSS
jgi:SAM-dependent methyltransferase